MGSPEGGQSMYRALSHQIYGADTNYMTIRRACRQYISMNKDYFQHFIDVDFERYLGVKRKGEKSSDYYAPGDHLDLQAVCELYDVRIIIYSPLSERPLD